MRSTLRAYRQKVPDPFSHLRKIPRQVNLAIISCTDRSVNIFSRISSVEVALIYRNMLILHGLSALAAWIRPLSTLYLTF